MTRPHFTDDFETDAIKQITERGYTVAEDAVEIRRLKRDLARFTEERDIFEKATVYFAKDAK